MTYRTTTWGLSVFALSAFACVAAAAGDSESFQFSIKEPLEIPQVTLTPGDYVIAVQDKLLDREIFTVKSASGDQVFSTFLAVASLDGKKGKPFTYWKAEPGKKTLRSWAPNNQDKNWEFIYPKERAVQIATAVKKTVPAADFNAIPKGTNSTLSDRDLQSIQLWALTPKRVKGKTEIAGAKIGQTEATAPAETAQAAPPPAPAPAPAPEPTPAPAPAAPVAETTPAPAAPVETAHAAPPPAPAPEPVAPAPARTSEAAAPAAPVQTARAAEAPEPETRKMPATANNFMESVLGGCMMVALGALLLVRRRSSATR